MNENNFGYDRKQFNTTSNMDILYNERKSTVLDSLLELEGEDFINGLNILLNKFKG